MSSNANLKIGCPAVRRALALTLRTTTTKEKEMRKSAGDSIHELQKQKTSN